MGRHTPEIGTSEEKPKRHLVLKTALAGAVTLTGTAVAHETGVLQSDNVALRVMDGVGAMSSEVGQAVVRPATYEKIGSLANTVYDLGSDLMGGSGDTGPEALTALPEVGQSPAPSPSAELPTAPIVAEPSLPPSPSPSPTLAPSPSPVMSPPSEDIISQEMIFAGSPTMQCQPGEKITKVNTDKKQIALTIDDGPSPTTTESILKQFEETDTVGTFFYVGQRLENAQGRELLKQTVEDGHQVALHSYRHYLYKADANAADQPLAEKAFRDILGGVPYAYRAPGFNYSPALESAVTESGQCFFGISQHGDTMDWEEDFEDPETAIKNLKAHDDKVLANLSPGMIILAHDQIQDLPEEGGRDRARVKAAEHIRYLIDGIEEQGYELVTLDQLLRVAE